MQHILLVSNNAQHQALLKEAIDSQNCSISAVLEKIPALAAELQEHDVDIVVIDIEAHVESELETVRQIMETRPLPIVMFVEQGDSESATSATAAGVSAYVVDGLQTERIAPIIAAAVTRFNETQTLRNELAQTKTSLQERKTIERAKGLLMEQRGCNENESYTALRQLAMARNKRLADIAQGIVDSVALLKS